METKKAIKIKNAILTLCDYLEVTPNELLDPVCKCDLKKVNKIRLAESIWNQFDEANIQTKSKLLGYE